MGGPPVHADCPSLGAIQTASETYGGLTGPSSWRARARWAALLPEASMRVRSASGWKEGSAASRSAVGPIDRDQSVEVRLTWHLDGLVFARDEPRLAELDRATQRARMALRQEVAKAYFAWQRLRARRADAVEADAAELALDEAEARALVDALTGGWLAQQPCR
ncbi:MAG: hypothetical protein R3B06_06560 [Kofleriaceae bacterium]